MQSTPQPRLKPIVWFLGAGALLVLLLGFWFLPSIVATLIPVPDISIPEPAAPPATVDDLPEEYKKRPEAYGVALAKGTPPTSTHAAQTATTTPPPWLPSFLQDTPPAQSQAPVATPTPTHPAQAPGADAQTPRFVQTGQRPTTEGKEPPKPGKWDYLARPKEQTARAAMPEAQHQALREKGDAQDIIRPAKWVMPSKPLLTIYRSMRMTGKLLDSINSDIPASTIRIALTEPLLDKFQYHTTILEVGTLVIVQQVGKAEFGQQRIPLKIEQIELISGEVIKVEGAVGDKDGAAGIPGKVNAHVGSLLLATGINAIMNLGLGYAGGTPGRGYYYRDPGQEAIQQAGQSVAQDVNAYTRQVLKRPPTIEVDAHRTRHGEPDPAIVTITLMENIQLNRAPILAR